MAQLRIILMCPQCSRGYEEHVDSDLRKLPYAFACRGCNTNYELRTVVVPVKKEGTRIAVEEYA